MTFVPMIPITASSGNYMLPVQSSFVSDVKTRVNATIGTVTDQLVLGLEKPKIHLPNIPITRYLKFGYYVDSQMGAGFLPTTGGTVTSREQYFTDAGDAVPGIILRANGFKGSGVGDQIIGEVMIRVYYQFQGKRIA